MTSLTQPSRAPTQPITQNMTEYSQQHAYMGSSKEVAVRGACACQYERERGVCEGTGEHHDGDNAGEFG
eukprot:2604562-Pyramimonas_sp.AAC.1